MGGQILRIAVMLAGLLAVTATGVASDPSGPAGEAETLSTPHSLCSLCHARAVGRSGPHGDLSSRPDARVCIGCHAMIVEAWDGRAALPAALSGHVRAVPRSGKVTPIGGAEAFHRFDCLSCHSPHPNGQPYQLIAEDGTPPSRSGAPLDPVSRTCARCHGRFLQTGRTNGKFTLHPVGVPAPKMRRGPGTPQLPLADVLGTETRLDDVVSCTTCHFTHNGPNPYLLRWQEEDVVAACTACHRRGEGQPAANLVASRQSSR